MLKALIPVDGSENALRAVRHVIGLVKGREPMEIHVVNVQAPVEAWEVKRVFRPEEIEAVQEIEGGDELHGARQLLDQAQVPYICEVLLGEVAPSIVKYAQDQGCDKIIMGTHGRSALSRLLLGSVTTSVIELSDIPVTLVK